MLELNQTEPRTAVRHEPLHWNSMLDVRRSVQREVAQAQGASSKYDNVITLFGSDDDYISTRHTLNLSHARCGNHHRRRRRYDNEDDLSPHLFTVAFSKRDRYGRVFPWSDMITPRRLAPFTPRSKPLTGRSRSMVILQPPCGIVLAQPSRDPRLIGSSGSLPFVIIDARYGSIILDCQTQGENCQIRKTQGAAQEQNRCPEQACCIFDPGGAATAPLQCLEV